jgi:hypothetical protein
MAVAYQKLSHSITDDAALEQNHITGAGRFERQVFRCGQSAGEPPPNLPDLWAPLASSVVVENRWSARVGRNPPINGARRAMSERWSPGRSAKVELQRLHPRATEDPMTEWR